MVRISCRWFQVQQGKSYRFVGWEIGKVEDEREEMYPMKCDKTIMKWDKTFCSFKDFSRNNIYHDKTHLEEEEMITSFQPHQAD